MSSVINDPGGKRCIVFKGIDGKRRALYLGKCGKGNAEDIRKHVDAILTAAMSLGTVAENTAKWLGKIPDEFHTKLVRAGLAVPREPAEKPSAAVLGPFVDAYLAKRGDLKPASQQVLGHAIRNLKEFFGASRPMESINAAEADDFRRWMEVTEKLAPATIGKRVQWCCTFWRDALRRKLIPENVFIDVNQSRAVNAERKKYIPRETIAAVIDACPDAEWKLLVALSRYLGLRVPSEPFSLTWNDIDWEKSRMRVTSVKTTRYEGRGSRWVPILPEVRPYLDDVYAVAPEGVYVFSRLRQRASVVAGEWKGINLRTRFEKIVTTAGFEPWPKLWHNLRASAQTDLAGRLPLHVVCAWLGNSEAIADKHYLQVTDAHFDLVLVPTPETARITTRAAQPGAVGDGRQETELAETPSIQGDSEIKGGPAGIRTQNQRIMSPLL